MISVQAYVDDTTIAGVASDPKWIHEVADAYRRVATAGFQVDSHNCFRAVVNDTMRFTPRLVTTEELLNYWPMVVTASQYSTLQEAISNHLQPGRCTQVVRISTSDLTLSSAEVAQRNHHVCVNLSYSQALDILSGACMHDSTALLAGPCACKSKSCVVTNHDLSAIYLKTLDDTKYGAQSVVSQAPALGLVLMARRSLKSTGEWGEVSEHKSLRCINNKPFQKFESRLRLFRQPQFSIMARSTAFNTYILSVMPYTISYFGLTSHDLNQLRQQAVKFILRRHWLDAETMPYAPFTNLDDPLASSVLAGPKMYIHTGCSLSLQCQKFTHPKNPKDLSRVTNLPILGGIKLDADLWLVFHDPCLSKDPSLNTAHGFSRCKSVEQRLEAW